LITSEALSRRRLVALLLAACALAAGAYAVAIAGGWLPFNSGAWLLGDEVAMRGWAGYLLAALAHAAAAFGLWKGRRAARWLAGLLLAAGVLAAIPGVSAAMVEQRLAAVALWGTVIVVRSAALYMLFGE
jgi:hypothetical protein